MTNCGACGSQNATKRCSRCQVVFYCDNKCQAQHWSTHKSKCVSVAIPTPPPPPPPPGSSTTRPTSPTSTPTPICDVIVKAPPQAQHFPPSLSRFVYRPSGDKIDENLLILLHGLGDSEKPFANWAAQLQLPQTACLTICAPFPVPLLEGSWMWFQAFDNEGEVMHTPPVRDRSIRISGLEETTRNLWSVLHALHVHCNWPFDRIHFFGFGQGGTVALHLAAQSLSPPLSQSQSRHCSPRTFASAMSVCGGLLPEASFDTSTIRGTNQNILGASEACEVMIVSALRVHSEVVKQLEDSNHVLSRMDARVTFQTFDRPEGMINGRNEMAACMAFWAKVLVRRFSSSKLVEQGFVQLN